MFVTKVWNVDGSNAPFTNQLYYAKELISYVKVRRKSYELFSL